MNKNLYILQNQLDLFNSLEKTTRWTLNHKGWI